jgi:hypothetical protein
MTTTVRVFVNAAALDVDSGSTALDCVRRWRADEADAVAAGSRLITDSRGLPISGNAPASAGSIYRTVPNRASSKSAE